VIGKMALEISAIAQQTGERVPVLATAPSRCDNVRTPDALPPVCAACAHSISAAGPKLKAMAWHVHC
jgi:hypothetical protein